MIISVRRWLLLPLLLLALLPITATAAPTAEQDGTLDPTFGSAGFVRTDVGTFGDTSGNGLALQPDGKLVAVGAGLDESGRPREFVLARFTATGAPDLNFADRGSERVELGGFQAEAKAVSIQPDGKILVAGRSDSGAVVARFTASGALDPTFGSAGVARFYFSIYNAVYNSLLLQPDGKIVAAGTISGDDCWSRSGDNHIYSENALISRLNANGTLDATFGSGGHHEIDLAIDKSNASEDLEGFNAVTLAPDGGLLAAGYLGRSTCDYSHSPPPPTPGSIVHGLVQSQDTQFALLRFTTAGALDSAFGTGGVVTTTLGSGVTRANALLADASSITLAGTSGGDFALARYSASGQLDASFGHNGIVSTNLGSDDHATALLALPNGTLIASGYSLSGTTLIFTAASYSSSGAQDTAFGQDGEANITFSPRVGYTSAAVLDTRHNRFLLVGTQRSDVAINVRSFLVLTAFSTTGQADPNFSAPYVLTYPHGGDSRDQINALAVQSDGKIVVAGKTDEWLYSDPGTTLPRGLIARYNPDGTPDFTLNNTGQVVAPELSAVNAVVVQPDKKILVGGTSEGSFAVERFRAPGNVDEHGFGNHGRVKINPTAGITGAVRSLILLDDGDIIAVGNSGANSLLLARLDANGDLDPAFGSGGMALYNSPSLHGANAAARQPDGKIVVALAGSPFAIARFNADGSLDSTFGAGGIINRVGNPADAAEIATAVAIQPDGKIVAAGGSASSGCSDLCAADSNYLIARSNPDGSPDLTFGTNGAVWDVDRSNGDYLGYTGGNVAMLLRPDGKIIVAGRHFGVVRRNPDGSPDLTFGANGQQAYDPNGQSNLAAIALQPDGNLLLAGTWNHEGAEGDLLLARVESRPSFNDVAPTDYFYEPVETLARQGVISGYMDGSFRPFSNTTRAQLAKIAVLAFGITPENAPTPTFTDVAQNNTFYSFIEAAVAHNIIGGYDLGNGRREFRPDQPVTRGQLAKIIVNAADWDLFTPTTATFADVPTSSVFFTFVETAVQHGIISGYSGPSGPEFRPGNNATRGQIAKIVYLSATHEN